MSNGNSSFDWLTFLLGFAIALWIAIVVLFLLPDDGHEQPATVVTCGSGNCGGRPGPLYRPGPLWIPPGGDSYFCTNRQDGGGYVEDAGGGPVQDAGGYVEDGGGYVEDAGGYVEDTAPRSPAPSDDHLAGSREPHEYHCETNNDGGGYVEDKTGRSVTVPMRTDGSFFCWKDGLGNAVVLRSEVTIEAGGATSILYYRTRLNRTQELVLLDGESPAAPDLIGLPAQPPELPSYVYCMVPDSGDEPSIINRGGDCVDGACASGS